MESFGFRSNFLPEHYSYCDIELQFHSETDFEARFHANINDLSEGHKWVREYEKLTKTNWKVKTTYGRNVCTLRKDYICRHNNFKCHSRGRSTKCKATMNIKITSSTKSTRNRNKWVREGMRATVTITNRHNHDITSAHALGFRKIDSHTRDLFIQYFNNGLSVASAMRYHISQLDMDPNIENHAIARADAAINPSRRTVAYLHDTWRKTNLGSRHDEGMWSVLEKKIQEYMAAGATVTMAKDRNIIVVVTAVMRRAHMLSTSSEIAFVDSTASCDAEKHTITFLMLTSSHGAVPGGFIITSGQREEDYVLGFSALKDALGDVAFAGKGSPEVFMTDDSSAERNALRTVWPSAKLTLCNFRILQATWHWLWDKKNAIDREERQQFMDLFQSLLYSLNVDVAHDSYQRLLNSVLNQGFREYVEQLWSRKESWCRAWQNIPSMGVDCTNNFLEITARLFIDHLLTQCKTGNVVLLVEFVTVVMDRYYRSQLEKFSNGRINTQQILLENLMKKADYITDSEKAKVQREPNSSIYLVPSERAVDKMYEVDPSVCCCTCADGMSGRICKHQMVVHKLFEETFPNVPDVTARTRHECAVLALGSAAEPFSFYARFDDSSCLHTSNNVVEPIKSEPPAELPPENNLVKLSDIKEEWKSFYTEFDCFLDQLEEVNDDVLSGVKKLREHFSHVHTATQLTNFLNSYAPSAPSQHHVVATIPDAKTPLTGTMWQPLPQVQGPYFLFLPS